MSDRITVATRKSKLALAQSRAWMEQLGRAAPGVELAELHVTTTGDRIQNRALSEIGGKGLFIKEIEEAMLDGRADLAVHSMKDVPAELAPGLAIGCIPAREDPRDVVITRSGCAFAELPQGARVGTSSLRRRTQLAAIRPDLDIVPLRGNVDTRMRKCREGEVDAIVLAMAGLKRLGLEQHASDVLEPETCLPAVGQGALAIELRTGDERVAAVLAPLVDEQTAVAVAAERGVMVAVEGSCQVPVAAHAVRDGAELWLRAFLAEPDGSRVRRDEARAPWSGEHEAHELGLEVGRRLRAG